MLGHLGMIPPGINHHSSDAAGRSLQIIQNHPIFCFEQVKPWHTVTSPSSKNAADMKHNVVWWTTGNPNHRRSCPQI
jgi:hypothetical protein